MGLAGALEALAQGWRETNPKVAIAHRSRRLRDIEEATALTAYRIVQEALTVPSTFRRNRVEVAVKRSRALHVVVRDNGAGLKRLVPRPRAVSACAI
jgi:two-component system sensor histidine kinase UhpB